MSDWKPYSVQARLGSMKVLCVGCQRHYSWRLSTEATPGTKGDRKGHHGRNSITDSVTALLTVPGVAQIEKMADNVAPIMWINPLLKPIEGHIENLAIPMINDIYGYFRATFNFVESVDPSATTQNTAGPISPNSSQAGNQALWNDFATDMDGLGDIPGQDGMDFSDAFANLGTSFDEMDTVFTSIIDEDGTWRDLTRSLDAFSATVDTFVDAAQSVEEFMGDVADAIETGPLLIVESTRDAIDNLRQDALAAVSFITQAPSDLFSMMADAGLAITETSVAQILEDNGIWDPLFVPAGVTVTLPL